MNFSDPYAKITEIQDRQLDAQTGSLERVKRNVLSEVTENMRPARPTPARTFRLAAAAAVFCLAVGAVVVWQWPTADSASSPEKAAPSQWLVASATQYETMTFDDESRIILSPGSSARVLQTAPAAVRVLLEKGRADVRVTHTAQTDWLLEAGPYTVAVTGTAFTIAWNGEAQKFLLNLNEGSVRVTGPMLEEGKAVKAGEQLATWVGERRMELSTHPSTPESTEKRIEIVELGSADSGTQVQHSRSVNSKKQMRGAKGAASHENSGAQDMASSWRQLCREGKYQAVVNDATAKGLHASISQGTIDDLMALGEAARLTRNKMVANETYQAVRQRFIGTAQASTAAFYLGKMAFDQHHAYGVAARWLEAYLQERDSGPLAKDALGKLFEAQQRIGKTAQAKQNARIYIERYPNGAHAPLAYKLLE